MYDLRIWVGGRLTETAGLKARIYRKPLGVERAYWFWTCGMTFILLVLGLNLSKVIKMWGGIIGKS